ncbi:BTAD domain-containing putative transcriptional regulator [Dactylosporangium sp. AC04546]|uniref:AfsR/SARP family transcriptional regulator n=1 Tax=Dactylosporangium sp. AC04546 TaxID=2862460 RepID=UPI001EDF4B6B|nr:BTAD domain-containing putative transcriptional regulator [Dactylosporangium sp. AC04546]WVK88329.1 BTAD domain-containing putative transcriptional regulator [Dactylosporangium sp. AC04546]
MKTDGQLRIQLLGDVVVRHDGGRAVDLGHRRQRCVLAVLLVEPNRPVPVEALLERAWGERLPRRPRDSLYSCVSRLKQLLAPVGAELVRRNGGYLIEVDPLAIDAHRFDHLVRQAQADAEQQRALDRFEEALALWAGDAFGTLDTPWLNGIRADWDHRRRAAERGRDELALRLGHHAAVLDGLLARAERDPLDEHLASQLLLALYRCGRQAEALARYDQLRRRLATELGIEPGEALRRTFDHILRADPGLTVAGAVAGPVPRQLPPPPVPFVGRVRQLGEMTDAVRGNAVAIVAISGAGGIGKTWLALHWAHLQSERFPDGQLYVNLRGFDPSGEPVEPPAAIRSLLAALGVPVEALPVEPDCQAGMFRSLVAGRRMLVVLDNARDSAQVIPLLPGSPGCAVIVTSRHRLTGLVAVHGARPVPLDLMTDAEALELLRTRLGPVEALAALLPHCAGLPLALGVVAARAATGRRPTEELAALAAELGDPRTRLDVLDPGDLQVGLRAVMASSVRALSPRAIRLLGYLGSAPGPDIGRSGAASMAGADPESLSPVLRELVDSNLLTEDPPRRYRMHDLIRLYVIERVSVPDRQPAMERLLDHYLHTAHAADRRLQPLRDPLTLPPVRPGVRVEAPADHRAALAWLTAEHQVLTAAVRFAPTAGFHRHAWQLAWALVHLLDQRGNWHEEVDVHRIALASAERLADDVALAHARCGLARGYTWLARFDEARTHLRSALAAFRRLGDVAGQGFAYRGLARVSARQGLPRRALADDRRALDLFDTAGHDHGRTLALNALGWHHAHLGEHDQAVLRCRQAIAIQQRIGDVHGEGMTWDTLGYAWYRSGDHRQAVAGFHRAARLLGEQADRYLEAVVNEHLGDAYAALGDVDAARTAWQRSARLLRVLGHPDAARLSAGRGSEVLVLGPDRGVPATGGLHLEDDVHVGGVGVARSVEVDPPHVPGATGRADRSAVGGADEVVVDVEGLQSHPGAGPGGVVDVEVAGEDRGDHTGGDVPAQDAAVGRSTDEPVVAAEVELLLGDLDRVRGDHDRVGRRGRPHRQCDPGGDGAQAGDGGGELLQHDGVSSREGRRW